MNEIISYSFLEWNIQGAGGLSGYTIQKFVADTIILDNVCKTIILYLYLHFYMSIIKCLLL